MNWRSQRGLKDFNGPCQGYDPRYCWRRIDARRAPRSPRKAASIEVKAHCFGSTPASDGGASSYSCGKACQPKFTGSRRARRRRASHYRRASRARRRRASYRRASYRREGSTMGPGRCGSRHRSDDASIYAREDKKASDPDGVGSSGEPSANGFAAAHAAGTHSDLRRDCAIGVMAKTPRAGRSKTRLCPPLTPEQAASLSAAFLRDATENMAAAAHLAPITGVSREWGEVRSVGSIAGWGNADAMGVAVDCDRR